MAETLSLQEVTDDKMHALVKLSDTLTPSQQRCVAPNAVSIAQGLMHGGWFRGIYLGDEPIGFVMVALHAPEIAARDQPAAFLWRYMIARPWQRSGYGARVLDEIVAMLRARGYRTFYTSCEIGEADGPLDFYLRYGFTDTGEQDDGGEEILRMELADSGTPRRLYLPAAPRIALVTIWTDEVEPMKRFYRDTLGMAVKNDLGDYVEFESPGVRFAVCKRTVMAEHSEEFRRPGSGQRFELAFPCEQPAHVDEAYETLVANGAAGVAAPQDMPWGQRTALFADPDGNIHEIFASLDN